MKSSAPRQPKESWTSGCGQTDVSSVDKDGFSLFNSQSFSVK